MKERFSLFLRECPIIAILRGITPPEVPAVCDVLYRSGIRLLEIPLNSPRAMESISIAAGHCGDRQMTGAGTVLHPEEVSLVHQAGGTFIISPNTSPEVIRTTRRLNLISIPGFYTPTEGLTAEEYGADYLKLFPALQGPGYIQALQAVIKTPILAVGGVNADNLPGFIRICHGAGIGSALYKPGKALQQIEQDAEKMISSLKALPLPSIR